MRKADNLPSSCAAVMTYGNLNFLEPSGPLQACNGTALPLPSLILTTVIFIKSYFVVSLTEKDGCLRLGFE